MRRVLNLTLLVVICAAIGAWYFVPAVQQTVDQTASKVLAMIGLDSGQTASDQAGNGGKGKGTGGKGGPVAVLTAVAKTADFPIRRYAIGFVTSPAVVDVSARISSQVVAVHVKDGQMVKKGDLLFTLDDRALKAQLDKDQAALDKDRAMVVSTQADLKRAQSLLQSKAGTQQAYDQADANAKAAAATVMADQAAIEADKVQLSFATIYAPITGRLGAVKITEGNLVTTGGNNGNSSPLVTITQMNPLQATFSLPEADLSLLKSALASDPPAKVDLFRNDTSEPLATGELAFVDSTVDTASGTITVKANMPNDDLKLWPGQFVNVRVDAGTMPRMTSIPTVAVQPGQNGSFVYVVKPDNTVDERPVKVALVVGGNSAISDGLKSGERVVTEGQSRLKKGATVREAPANQAAASPGTGQKVATDEAADGAKQ